MRSLRSIAAAAFVFTSALSSLAQNYHWSAFAGLPPQLGSADGAAANARFNRPVGMVGDASGTLYVTDSLNHTIRRISPTGVVTTLAGSAGQIGITDGVGSAARFALPAGITLSNGFLYVADRVGSTIRRVSGNGIVTTFAGRGGTAGFADGAAANARFNDPFGIVGDSSGNIFVVDRGNHAIRKIAPDGTVTTFAGLGGTSGSADGIGTAARFNAPLGLDIDAAGTLYVADGGNHTIRKITPAGVVTTLAGSPGFSGTTNGTGTAARFSFPHSVLVFGDGNLVVSDNGNDCLRVISPTGTVALFAGRLNVEGFRDGGRTDARFYSPAGLAFTADGLAVADSLNFSIRKVSLTVDSVTTFAGPAGNFGRQDGAGAEARFNYPGGVAVHSSGDVYLADSRGNTIRRISPAGVVVTVANFIPGDAYVDGPPSVASLNYPVGVAVAPDRTVYFCEQQRHTIRMARPDGTVSTIAGTEGVSGTGDGTGAAARFNFPSGIARDTTGNLYIADTNNSAIRRIAAGTSTVTLFAGVAGSSGSADGTGTTARFFLPRGICTDADGNVYVADAGNHTIRRITPAGVVTTLAGQAGASGAVDGTGSAARFFQPAGIAIDAAGRLFVADTVNYLVRRIVGNVVTTIGGTAGQLGYADGSGSNARFHTPNGIAVDANGTLYLSQAGNNLVARGALEAAPEITAAPQSLTVTAGSSGTFRVAATGSGLAYQWKHNGVSVPGATSATYVIASVGPSNTGDYTVEITNALGSVTSPAATLAIGTSSNAGRIVNLSILTNIPAAGENFTMGFVVGGAGTTGTKPLVIRAAGPSLGALGVAGTLDDPRLELFAGSTKIGENDNWGGSASLALAMQSVGAFAYTSAASRDAASTGNFNTGDQSVKVSAAGNGIGAVIAEIYDATPTDSFTAATPRLVNVSVLKHLGSGLTAGFVIGGATSKTVLIRAIGPTIGAAPFNVGGVVADPQLTLYSGSTVLERNDNWGGTAALNAAFSQVGAFALPNASRDAALVATLPPGNYTVEVSGTNTTTGLALVEVYEVP